MDKKQKFITEIENSDVQLSEDAKIFFEALKMSQDADKPMFTENGKLILQFVQENKDNYTNLFKAKDIGEGIGITSRAASGAMRKLVADGFLAKISQNPVVYSVTEKGMSVTDFDK